MESIDFLIHYDQRNSLVKSIPIIAINICEKILSLKETPDEFLYLIF